MWIKGKGANVFEMIKLTRLNESEIYVNPHQLETMESCPDTVIRMLSERQIIVKEGCEEIVGKIIEYRRKIGVEGNEGVL